jgi:hypothetical protein
MPGFVPGFFCFQRPCQRDVQGERSDSDKPPALWSEDAPVQK